MEMQVACISIIFCLDDPMFNVTFANSRGIPRLRTNRRVGRPRDKWITANMESAWEKIGEASRNITPYAATSDQIETIMIAAKKYKL